MYNWQLENWPSFIYSFEGMEDILFDFATSAGRVSVLHQNLPAELQLNTLIQLMVAEAVKTSEIEGEMISREDVISSIKYQMGLQGEITLPKDIRAQGIAALMLEVRKNFQEPLSEELLYNWHQLLMQGNTRIHVGQWRNSMEPMRVVSGGIGREVIHFEAPPSKRVPGEMKRYIDWFNDSQFKGINPVVRSAIAHVYFESIHPFEDGNGRIGRALSEKVLAQGLGRPVLLSLSQMIEKDRKAYYESLKTAQRTNDISGWITYFARLARDAQVHAEREVIYSLQKAKFFDSHKHNLNPRQYKVIQKMLLRGIDGFEGGMSAKKYISITKSSKATATRDLQDLVEKNIFSISGSGRSTRYLLNIS